MYFSGVLWSFHVLVVQPGSSNCVELGGELNEVHVLTKDINCDHDGVVAMGLW